MVTIQKNIVALPDDDRITEAVADDFFTQLWCRLAADLPRAAPPRPPKTGCMVTNATDGNNPWLVPFPSRTDAARGRPES